MKVDNPKFAVRGWVWCECCPFADKDGYSEQGTPLNDLCDSWGRNHDNCCPTEETYEEACLLADSYVKK